MLENLSAQTGMTRFEAHRNTRAASNFFCCHLRSGALRDVCIPI